MIVKIPYILQSFELFHTYSSKVGLTSVLFILLFLHKLDLNSNRLTSKISFGLEMEPFNTLQSGIKFVEVYAKSN